MKGSIIIKLISALIFIVAIMYLAGMAWTAIRGASTPEGVAFFYPWLPR